MIVAMINWSAYSRFIHAVINSLITCAKQLTGEYCKQVGHFRSHKLRSLHTTDSTHINILLLYSTDEILCFNYILTNVPIPSVSNG